MKRVIMKDEFVSEYRASESSAATAEQIHGWTAWSPSPWSVWAPRPERLRLMIMKPGDAEATMIIMRKDAYGWWHPDQDISSWVELYRSGEAVDYGYLLDETEVPRPDPRSRNQPYGVHGLSQSFDPSRYGWADSDWRGRQLPGGVIYELHIGTFTPGGTLRSAIERLDHLVDLGISFVELMPVNSFNGTHNWGYDGVAWFAVHYSYGGPEAYQEFVDACHRRGLGVIQDVVYNHLGPSGNYLPVFGPYLAGSNVWGDSVNLDGPESDEVRRYIIDNAMMWFRDFHVDGLRLDAVHALKDTRATHLLEELAIETDALSTSLGRPLALIAESDLNNPRMITSRHGAGYGLTGQWNDDFHHALYVSLTGDTSGYYADFGSLEALTKVFEHGFFHDGNHSSFRGRAHGQRIDTSRISTWRLVVCSDNHDQIGNRADGSRLSTKLDQQQLALAAVLTLLSPFTPMIFMGEEWGARTPWAFFTSHPEEELAQAVREGRKSEFAAMAWDLDAVPDPQAPSTFTDSHLDWSELDDHDHAELLELNKQLLLLRKAYPDITDPRFDRGRALADDADGWLLIERGQIVIVINFHADECEVELPGAVQHLLNVGRYDLAEESVRLGGHSALVARLRGRTVRA